jgi:hypothetical protein
VKIECYEREEPIHTRNQERSKRGEIILERESEEKRGRRRRLVKILTRWHLKLKL